MASIEINEIIKWVDKLDNWKANGDTTAREALNIKFSRGNEEIVFDEDYINKSISLQSRDGNVVIDFDKNGLIINIEIS